MKKYFILSIYILSSISIGIYFNFFDNSNLTVTSTLDNFKLTIDGNTKNCLSNSCLVKVKNGTYNLLIEKDGYYDYIQKLKVSKDASLQVNLQKEISLDLVNKDDYLPPFYIEQQENQSLVFKTQDNTLITTFSNLKNNEIIYSSDLSKLALFGTDNIYFYDSKTKEVKKIKAEILNQPFKITNKGTLLVESTEGIQEKTLENQKISSIGLKDLNRIIQVPDNSFIVVSDSISFDIATEIDNQTVSIAEILKIAQEKPFQVFKVSEDFSSFSNLFTLDQAEEIDLLFELDQDLIPVSLLKNGKSYFKISL